MEKAEVSVSDWHTAKQGLVGIGADGHMFGITCEHVTLSTDGALYMDIGKGQMVKIGMAENRGKEKRNALDIDCLELNIEFETYFSQNPSQFKPCTVFQGPMRDLYGKRIFRSSAPCGYLQEEGRNYGLVATADEHVMCDKIISNNNLLIAVESPGNGSFATKGNSGDYVAFDQDGCTYVIGIITSGDYIPPHRKGKPPYTVCLFLKSALTTLRKRAKQLFASCTTLMFKTPEKINPIAFNLLERLINLIDLKMPEVDIDEIQRQLKYEKTLSGTIDSRTDITPSIFPEDEPFQACILNSVMACSSLWSNDVKKTEKHLKMAARCLPDVGPMLLLMLCKVLVAAAWYYRIASKPNDAKEILDQSWTFMQEFIKNSTFPKSSEFYVYFEYAMHYKDTCDDGNATKYALCALEHSRNSYRDNPSSTSAGNRYLLAVCTFADIKLKCGDKFETRDAEVSQEAIGDVERYMDEVESIYDETDPTAQSFFLLRKCDMFYRRQSFDKAREMASKCRDLAKKAGIKKDRDEAIFRIRALQEYF